MAIVFCEKCDSYIDIDWDEVNEIDDEIVCYECTQEYDE